MQAHRTIKTHFNIFIGIIVSLCLIGLLSIYSASSVFALEKLGAAHYYLSKQLLGFGLGVLCFLFFWCIPIQNVKKMSFYLFIGSFLLTLLTLVKPFGITMHGASRWIKLGHVILQPSELLKMFSLVYIAHFLSRTAQTRSYHYNRAITLFLSLLSIIGAITVLLLAQPDFGTAFTLALVALILYNIVYMNVYHIMATIGAGIPLLMYLIYQYPYRLRRVLIYLNPWADPHGAGFQIIQSLIAIGSGGLYGKGLGHSKQKFFYLPMQHTDFIFSIIAEETGFIGASIIIMLYVALLYYGFRLALAMNTNFSMLLIFGYTLLINVQALINIAVAIGLFPTKGIGLPFISFGCSALIAHLCFLGIVARVVYETTKTSKPLSY